LPEATLAITKTALALALNVLSVAVKAAVQPARRRKPGGFSVLLLGALQRGQLGELCSSNKLVLRRLVDPKAARRPAFVSM
jgi:hypothetical protein